MPNLYVKEDLASYASTTFIYHIQIQKISGEVVELIEDKFVQSEVAKKIGFFQVKPKKTDWILLKQVDLYCAPKQWLMENGFIPYIIPEKKKKTKKSV